MLQLAKIWQLARRDLRGRFAGLRLLITCLFLGVATLATIGSLTIAIVEELSAQGQAILGGDLEISISQREISTEERTAAQQLGTMSETLRMQAMARLPDGSDTQLTELKGVDSAYPLYGKFQITGKKGPINSPKIGDGDILVSPALLQRLSLKIGDAIDYGEHQFVIKGTIDEEPDRLSEGLSLGPVAITSVGGVKATKLIQPGSLFEAKYRLKLAPDRNAVEEVDKLNAAFPFAGWELKTRQDGAPSTRRFIERMGQFLTLVGLASLIIAGIGVGNGVSSYLRGKQNAIATLKILGADSNTIFRIYLMQIMAVAIVSIFAGLIIGALAPTAIVAIAGDVLPISPGFALYPLPLIISGIYGLLIAFIFALVPLARAKSVPAAGLFRGDAMGWRGLDRKTLIWLIGAITAIFALAIGSANEPIFSAFFLMAAVAILILLTVLAWAIRDGAQRIPRPKQPLLRLALTNLHRPGAQTGQLVIALGLGLTLFATLAGIQTSLNNEIALTLPKQAPNFFVLDIPVERQDEFREDVKERASEADINIVPTLRGTIVEYGGQRVSELEQIPEGAWVLQGDRGITYSDIVPEGSELVSGEWWGENYDGPPLVSIDLDVAEILGIDVGDSLTIGLLGVEIKTRVASLRKVNWRNFGFNYVLVFPPNMFAKIPHNVAATIQVKQENEAQLLGNVPKNFPSISMVRVKEIAGQITVLLDQMATAIASAASIAILSGIAVLVGAIAASRQSRTYDSVILKLLGATRRQVLASQAIEYFVLALLLAGVAFALGALASWYVITQIFEFGWQPDWGTMALTLIFGALITLGIGLIGSLPILSARPAQALRAL